MIGGAFCPTEGKANPLKVTPAFARAALRHGARILSDTVLTGLAPERERISRSNEPRDRSARAAW